METCPICTLGKALLVEIHTAVGNNWRKSDLSGLWFSFVVLPISETLSPFVTHSDPGPVSILFINMPPPVTTSGLHITQVPTNATRGGGDNEQCQVTKNLPLLKLALVN